MGPAQLLTSGPRREPCSSFVAIQPQITRSASFQFLSRPRCSQRLAQNRICSTRGTPDSHLTLLLTPRTFRLPSGCSGFSKRLRKQTFGKTLPGVSNEMATLLAIGKTRKVLPTGPMYRRCSLNSKQRCRGKRIGKGCHHRMVSIFCVCFLCVFFSSALAK